MGGHTRPSPGMPMNSWGDAAELAREEPDKPCWLTLLLLQSGIAKATSYTDSSLPLGHCRITSMPPYIIRSTYIILCLQEIMI